VQGVKGEEEQSLRLIEPAKKALRGEGVFYTPGPEGGGKGI